MHQHGKRYDSKKVEGVLHIKTELSLSTFNLCSSQHPTMMAEMKREGNVLPYSDAAKALQVLLCNSLQYFFFFNQAMAASGGTYLNFFYFLSLCSSIFIYLFLFDRPLTIPHL